MPYAYSRHIQVARPAHEIVAPGRGTTYDDGDDLILDDEDDVESSITCSLVSTSMSPNQTCDDLPGLGRIIDTYVYQPGGRYIERRINNFLASRKSRRDRRTSRSMLFKRVLGHPADEGIPLAKRVIDIAFDVITSFFNSAFLRRLRPDDHPCRHTYWTRAKQTSVVIGLSDYLYIWGVQSFAGWDPSPLFTRCRHVMSLITYVVIDFFTHLDTNVL